jgi:amino acid adenylation domain-containing protein
LNASPNTLSTSSAAVSTLPASCGQERLWTLHQWEANRTAYNVPAAFDFSGPLEVEALRESCLDVVRRHEVLRTTFVAENGELLEWIHDEAVCPFEVVDIAALPETAQEAKIGEVTRALVHHAFDLERGPLLRCVLLRLGEDSHRLLFNAHHIVCDGWSLDILLRELATFYKARLFDTSADLDPLPIQYGDYAAWQRDWLKSDAFTSQLNFWKEHLRTLPEPLALPTDRPTPAQQSAAGADLFFELPPDLATALEAYCPREGTTPFMVLMAAFQTLLYRYTGQEEFLVGTPVANRSRVEIESLIGFFVNTVVLRAALSSGVTFRELVNRVRNEALDVFANADLPYEKLVEQLQPSRRDRSPLFRTMFVLQEPAEKLPEFPKLKVETRPLELGAAKFDLLLEITVGGGNARGCLSYSTDLFDRPTMDRLIRHLTTLLRGLLAEPEQPIASIVLTEYQEQQQLSVWSRGALTPYPATQTVHAVFEQQAAKAPDALALADGELRLTYGELDRRANRFANYLIKQGFKPGDAIGLYAHRYWPFLAGIIGILKMGGAYVPLDPRDPPARIAMLRKQLAGMLEEKFDAADESAEQPPAAGQPEGAAYVMFTSGSTGEPKGVVVPHQGITRLVCSTDYVQFDSKTVMSQGSNLCFDASTFEIWGALLNGGSLVYTRSDTVLDHVALSDDIKKHGINSMFLTTSLFNQHARQAPEMFAGLRCVAFGGEAADPAMVQRVLEHGRPQSLVNGYGPTETTTFAVCHRITEVKDGRVPIGRPIANCDAFLLDANLKPVPVGVTGEIYIGGPGVALGYLNRPELTAERFVKTPFGRMYRTGDFGRWLPDGTIDYQGRIDQQFKLRGFRIEPAEIEALLRLHPAVAQCAVLFRKCPSGDKVIVAYFVRRPGHEAISDADFRKYLIENLPQTFMPYQWFWLDALPLTANGKLDQRALPEPTVEVKPMREYVPAKNSTQSHLIEIWQEVFQRKPIGIRDDFFELGGHSLLAAKIVSLITERLGHRLSFGEFFTSPTIENHALVLTGAKSPVRQSHWVAIHPAGTKTPVFFFHGDYVGGGFFCKTLAAAIGTDRPFYAIHPHGLQGDEVPMTIEAMAAERLQSIRSVQPHGPYLLGGYCNGALIAFEAARILRRQGEKVSVVMMLYPDGRNVRFRWLKSLTRLASALRREDEATAVQRYLGTRRRLRDREDMALYYLRTTVDLIKSPSWEKAAPFLARARRIFGRSGPAGAEGKNEPSTEAPQKAGAASPLSGPYGNACRAYVPGRYDAQVLVLWPKNEEYTTARGPVTGWEKVCRQLEVQEVPGDHHSCIALNSNVAPIGDSMKKAIDRAESLLSKRVS